MAEKRTQGSPSIHDVEFWRDILDWYSGSPELYSLVTMKTVWSMLQAGQVYKNDNLTKYCCKFLELACSPDNCLQIKRMATERSLESVAKKATQVFARNFSKVSKSADFLSLGKSEVLEVLDKELLVTTEDDACAALLGWMAANNDDADTCTELFQHISLQKLSCDFLAVSVQFNNIVFQTPDVSYEVQEENRRRIFQRESRRNAAVTRRCGFSTNKGIVVVGDIGGETCLSFWSPSKKWLSFNCKEIKKGTCLSSTLLGNTIITTGNHPYNSCYFHDMETATWKCGPSLVQPRFDHGMATVRGRAYVVGGRVDDDFLSPSLSSIEELCMEGCWWSDVGDLMFQTSECGVTSLGDTILVAGGDRIMSQTRIQTFNVMSKTAAVLDFRLPCPMPRVRATRHGNTAFFVGSEGDLVQITETEEGFKATAQGQLQGFGKKKWFGLHTTDTCVLRLSGGEKASVDCWDHTGNKLAQEEMADLRRPMSIVGVFETVLPHSIRSGMSSN